MKTSPRSVPLTALSMAVAMGLGLSTFAGIAQAAGFALSTQSGAGTGNAFAGAAAVAEDASTTWFNPAGLTELPAGQQFSVAGHFISPKAEFTNVGSWVNPALTGGDFDQAQALLSGRNSDGGNGAGVPNAYYARSFGDQLRFGIGVNAPFGLGTKYDEDWIGRYVALESNITAINVNPALAYKVNEQWSVGAGVSLQYMKVELKSVLDSAATCRSIAAGANNGDLLASCLANLPTIANQATDSKATIEGDNIAYGYNLGVLFKPSPATKVGVSYRSKIDQDLEGTVKYDLHPALQPVASLVPRFANQEVTAAANLPASLSLSVAHQLNDKVELLGDVTRTNWSSFERLTVKPVEGDYLITDVNQDWKDSNRYSLGLNYQQNPRLKLRAGLAYDETPIRNAKLRTPRTPDNDRTWATVGANYKLAKGLDLDVGYARLFTDQTPIDNTNDDNGYAVRGYYDASVNIFSTQLNWSF